MYGRLMTVITVPPQAESLTWIGVQHMVRTMAQALNNDLGSTKP
jgi:hypothetical protein